MEKITSYGPINRVYYLCLIDWETHILKSHELTKFSNQIMGPSKRICDGWAIEALKWSELQDCITNAELGFYHSRLIFRFDLKSAPKNILEVRELREKLESRIEKFCSNKVIPAIKSFKKTAKLPLIFIYPIFELNHQEDFWNFKGQKPYSLPTTCFFTELDDPKGEILRKKVKMRISGAKIIASNMSEWFFNNLVNIVFHEGLYRQTRDKKAKKLLPEERVYKGLENRLEDFASKLMTTFHEFSSEHVRRRIAEIALYASVTGIVVAIVFALINLASNLLKP